MAGEHQLIEPVMGLGGDQRLGRQAVCRGVGGAYYLLGGLRSDLEFVVGVGIKRLDSNGHGLHGGEIGGCCVPKLHLHVERWRRGK